jgi:hypothetical protein
MNRMLDDEAARSARTRCTPPARGEGPKDVPVAAVVMLLMAIEAMVPDTRRLHAFLDNLGGQ